MSQMFWTSAFGNSVRTGAVQKVMAWNWILSHRFLLMDRAKPSLQSC